MLVGRTSELELILQAVNRADLAGAVLCGPPGVGKSTLLAAVAAESARQHGFEVIHLHANRATSTIPLFVFSSLLGRTDAGATIERFVEVREALREMSARRPLLLAIDDAHELDDASAVLVSQLARESTAFVLASVRAAEPAPEPIAALWVEGIAVRIDIAPLSREESGMVAGSVLGGLIDPGLEAEIWRRASGNPLHIRELILGSRDTGSLELVDDVWSRTGDLVISGALTDLIGQRVARLSAAEQSALCAVALAEPAGVALIEAVADSEVLVALEQAGLVSVQLDRRRLTVRIAHPTYGEAVRAMTSQLRVRTMRRELAAAITAWGAKRLDDLIQVATWRLDAGDSDSELFATAAFEALRRHDMDLAERLAVAAHDELPTAFSARALAMTRHLLGRHGEALAVLDTARTNTDFGPHDLARIELLQGLVLARGEGDYTAAVSVLHAISADATDRVRRRASAMLALISLLQGRVTDGLGSAEQLIIAGASDPEAYTALVGSMAVHGQPGRALALADDFVRSHGEPDPRSLFPDFRWVAMIDAGRLVEMEAELDTAWTIALEQGDRHRQARLALALAVLHVDTGQLTASMAWAERSASLARSIGERFGIRWALSARLLAASKLGDLAAAKAASATLSEVPGHPAELFEIYGRRGAGWLSAALGRSSDACDDLLSFATQLIEDGSITHAVRTLVDVACLGEPGHALEVLNTINVELDGDLMPLCVAFVTALAAADAAELESVSIGFEQHGYGNLAVAAALATRDIYARSGRSRDANGWTRKAEQLLSGSGELPGLSSAELDSVATLTRRERQIAHLVTQGYTNREVAESSFLSIRTVENHLARIYQKLGVRSRAELASALTPLLASGTH